MKVRNIYQGLMFILIFSGIVTMFCSSVFAAEQGYLTYSVTTEVSGLNVMDISYDGGQISATVQLSDDMLIAEYNPITLVALNFDGAPCAIRESEADESGNADFSFKLDTVKTVSGNYTFLFNSPKTGKLVCEVRLYDEISDAMAELSGLMDEVSVLLAQCEERNIPTDYESVYFYTVDRSLEIMRERGLDDAYTEYNLPICIEFAQKVKTNLCSYLDGSKVSESVVKVTPDSINVDRENFTAIVNDGGVEYRSPVFLNGFNAGWENRDETEFLSNLGVNSVSYTIPINRILGRPNNAYKWSASGAAAQNGEIFQKGADSSLYISSSQGRTGIIYQMLALKSGETYKIKFRAKGVSSGNAFVKIGLSGQADVEWNIQGTSDWVEYEYIYTPANTYNPEFKIVCSGNIEGIYIDDVSVTDSEGNEMLLNGDFDEWFDITENVSEGVYGINSAAIAESEYMLEKYKQNGYSVVLTGGFASMPTYVTTMSGVKDSGASYNTYIPYNPTHPKVLSAIETYIEAVLPIAEQVGNVMCFMIHNEPSFNSYGKAFYNEKWQAYLSEKYEDVSELNMVYGTSYSSLSDVPMQNSAGLSPAQKLTKQYYDWRVFNDSILTEYHNTIAEYTENVSSIPVATKIMQEFSQSAALVQHYGTDYESFGINMGINGNDGWARPDASGQRIEVQLMWYDYQRSINPAPVFNMENHFALDSETLNYSYNYADTVNAMLWQGALHGLSGNHMWLFGRSDELYPDFVNTTIQYRADVMAQIGKTGLDINRLIDEISALREKSAEAAILFSETSKSYNRQYENALYNAYTGALSSGVKTDLITESKITNVADYNLLIIPEATHVTDEVVAEIYEFATNGGKILMLADDCMKYNENGMQRSDMSEVNAIKSSATVISGGARSFAGSNMASVTNVAESVKQFCIAQGKPIVEVVSESGENVSNVDIAIAENGGKLLVNICNFGNEEISVYIKRDGTIISELTNMIDNSVLEDTIVLKPNVPMLLSTEWNTTFGISRPTFGTMEFNDNEFSPDGYGGTIIENNLENFSDKNVFAQVDIYNDGSEDKMILALALKNDKLLKNISVVSLDLQQGMNKGTVVCRAENCSNGDYIELFLWKDDIFEPFSETYKLRQAKE